MSQKCSCCANGVFNQVPSSGCILEPRRQSRAVRCAAATHATAKTAGGDDCDVVRSQPRVDEMATSKSRKNVPTHAFPIDQLLNALVEMLIVSIDEFHVSTAEQEKRDAVATAIHRLECTSKANQSTLLADGRLQFYRCFYHTLSTNNALPRRFLDATFGVSLLTGSFGQGPSETQRFGVLTPKDVLQDRLNTARRLASLDVTEVLHRSSKYMPEDLPDGVGPRVAAFIGRSRFVTQIRAQDRPTWVVTCGLGSCSCRFLCSEGGNVGGPALVDLFGEQGVSSSEEDEDEEDENEPPVASYWSTLSPRPLTALPRRTFCSLACALKYEDEIRSAIPIRVSDAETHESFSSASGKLGLARVMASTRAAFKRNDAAARALRDSMRDVRKRQAHNTVKPEIYNRIHQNIIDVLNIDLGLLYAASSLAESPASCVNRQLPATAPCWRDGDLKKFSRAIERVKSLYVQHYKTAEGLARDERYPPKWLIKVKEASTGLFPVRATLQ